MRTVFFIIFLFGLSFSASANERIYCPLPEDGIWENKTAKNKEISRIEIESRCVDNSVIVRMRAYTRCSPRDCKWGWSDAELREYGGLKSLLIGFLTTKVLFVRNFNDLLDVRLIEIPHDPKVEQKEEESYTLTRAKR